MIERLKNSHESKNNLISKLTKCSKEIKVSDKLETFL